MPSFAITISPVAVSIYYQFGSSQDLWDVLGCFWNGHQSE